MDAVFFNLPVDRRPGSTRTSIPWDQLSTSGAMWTASTLWYVSLWWVN